jgi:CRISPR/Cas system Type II protein with McrA/HNH and RuvC-like nuclease domain
MAKTLGLDIGTNSIGWALIDNNSNKIIDCGVKIFPSKTSHQTQLARQQRRTENRFMQRVLAFYNKVKLTKEINPVILTLISCSALTALLTILNFSNWQFWLNLSLTVFVATLSLIHQPKDK